MTYLDQLIAESLPDPLAERCRFVVERQPPAAAEFVLYWMRNAIRADENQALDVAILIANRLELPIFVYHALSDRYPYASDRHHTFILEGARDVQADLSEREIGAEFHLARPGHQGSHLKTLAARAAVIVTEEMPVDPLRSWTNSLAAAVAPPVLAVDTACVVPMRIVDRAYDRAFAYERATKRLYAERISRPAVEVDATAGRYVPDNLPFEPIDFSVVEIGELVSSCEIDHAIGPVPHTPGGTRAGYARWEEFKQQGLASYDRRRNDPLADGVSRLSPYLHYGMVSPQRIAREAAGFDNRGAEKFLNELLIWRELAYAFCFYRDDHASLNALPQWARETLAEHTGDPRPGLLSWETLARARTKDRLWDAAQRSLLLHGELHNNVRMTWGKAITQWTPDARSALAMIIDLNHRFALDGRDPASYGGILWCLGQFDRPFPPPRPILGTVRDRGTAQHARRLDIDAYSRHVTRPIRSDLPTVAVVGGGISGLTAARTLIDHGLTVTVFEKSRGVGGRMATRRGEQGIAFDHGAQYFTVRDERFRRYVDSWLHDGVVAAWQGRIAVLEHGEVQEYKSAGEDGGMCRYVGVPGMNAICKHLARDLDVRLQTQVHRLENSNGRWELFDGNDLPLGEFQAVIVSAPPAQTAALLRSSEPIRSRAENVDVSPCWAMMIAFPQPLPVDYAAAFVNGSPISWIARNGSKPGRASDVETWVVHAAGEWTRRHLELSPEEVQPKMLDAFFAALGIAPQPSAYLSTHRWRYALPADPPAERCLVDRERMAFACGDWCGGPRVEGAFLSGMAVAGRLLGVSARVT